MDNHIIPPPPPPPPPPFTSVKPVRKQVSYGYKIVLIALQCCLLMFGVLAVWSLSYSRESTSNRVVEEISSDWGRGVSIQGPVVAKHLDSDKKVRPSTFVCNAQVATKPLHRGIYEAEVFNSSVVISGTFDRDSVAVCGDSLIFRLDVSTKEISKLGNLKIDGKEYLWSKSPNCLFAEVKFADMPEKIDFSTEFDIHGSGEIFVKQIGRKSSVVISGEASNPSFNGSRLPNDRTLIDRNFKANWDCEEILEYDENTGEYVSDIGSVGVNFLVGVDRYQKVERSLKYAIVIILLTFISVLFAEIVVRHPIPLLNYFLIGAALILFYSLLLAFVEHTTFGFAYLISAGMTVALIMGYMWRMLNSRKVGVTIGLILSAIYVSCYIMLCISTYALLLGSFILFVSLAAMMYGSLKIKR